MSELAAERLRIEGVNEFWFRPDKQQAQADGLAYRPAVLIECSINFRSLRAGLNHSEERSYAAWLPESVASGMRNSDSTPGRRELRASEADPGADLEGAGSARAERLGWSCHRTENSNTMRI